MGLINSDPTVYTIEKTQRRSSNTDLDDSVPDEFDPLEIFELIRNINDPEHPLTLEQLHVLVLSQIYVDNFKSRVEVHFTPTIPHCSMATLIGLCIRVQLERSLPSRFKVKVGVQKGTHQSEDTVNRQLNDKERVVAALENSALSEVVSQCLATTN